MVSYIFSVCLCIRYHFYIILFPRKFNAYFYASKFIYICSLYLLSSCYVYHKQNQDCFQKGNTIFNLISVHAPTTHTLRVTVKPVLSSHSYRTPKVVFQYRLLLNAGQKYCSIKLPFSIKTLVLSFFKWLVLLYILINSESQFYHTY